MIAQQFTPRALNDAPTEDRRPPRDERLTLALERYAAAIDAGHPLSKDELLAQFADVADELRGCLDSLDFIREVAPQLGDSHVGESHRDSHSAVLRGSLDPAHPASRIQHPASSPATLGDFRILREIGRGGMGVVYEAEQLSLGRRVALKVLPFAAMLDRQQLARFKNEARAAATLDHPNIVAIHSVGVERSVHYYAMQLIEGQSLAEVIAAQRRRHLPLPPGEGRGEGKPRGARSDEVCSPPLDGEGLGEGCRGTVAAALSTLQSVLPTPSSLPPFSSREYIRTIARLGIQAAEALDHAHSNGILHRDIKPANLMVDDTGKLWITDFGLARIEQDAGMTMTGDLLGTLRYMSPEQALAKRVFVDHRSDIYSLGVTLYELITLQPAFAGDDRQELLRQIAFEEPRKPRQVNTHISPDLETIVLKAIEKNPADRYLTAQEFAGDLQRFAGNQPIKAKRPTLFNCVYKWSSRHRGLLLSATLAAVTTSIVLLVSIFQLWREKERTATALNEHRALVDYLVNELLASSIDEQNRGVAKKTLAGLGKFLKQQGNHAEAVRVLNASIQGEPNNSYVLNRQAWLLATSRLDALRDGPRALELAKAACERSNYQIPTMLNTLAAAYAEVGDFDAAIIWAQRAYEMVTEPVRSEQFASHLKSYQAKKPWRE